MTLHSCRKYLPTDISLQSVQNLIKLHFILEGKCEILSFKTNSTGNILVYTNNYN